MIFASKFNRFAQIIRAKFSAFLAKGRREKDDSCITNTQQKAKISESRDMDTSEIRDIEPSIIQNIGIGHCPYCQSKDFVKRGMRQKKKEREQ